MLSETLSDGLENYRIGPKIRELRSAKALGLAQLADHTGLSAGMLSKIERGVVFPTLPTLLRIALVFGVGLEHFFADSGNPVLEITRSKDRVRLPDTTERMPSYYFESLDYPANDRPFNAHLAEFLPRTPASDPHKHNGAEFVYVMAGTLELHIHDREITLNMGDSVHFDADHLHSYRCLGDDRCRAIVVSATASA